MKEKLLALFGVLNTSHDKPKQEGYSSTRKYTDVSEQLENQRPTLQARNQYSAPDHWFTQQGQMTSTSEVNGHGDPWATESVSRNALANRESWGFVKDHIQPYNNS